MTPGAAMLRFGRFDSMWAIINTLTAGPHAIRIYFDFFGLDEDRAPEQPLAFIEAAQTRERAAIPVIC